MSGTRPFGAVGSVLFRRFKAVIFFLVDFCLCLSEQRGLSFDTVASSVTKPASKWQQGRIKDANVLLSPRRAPVGA